MRSGIVYVRISYLGSRTVFRLIESIGGRGCHCRVSGLSRTVSVTVASLHHSAYCSSSAVGEVLRVYDAMCVTYALRTEYGVRYILIYRIYGRRRGVGYPGYRTPIGSAPARAGPESLERRELRRETSADEDRTSSARTGDASRSLSLCRKSQKNTIRRVVGSSIYLAS